jgi:hypothetical protein
LGRKEETVEMQCFQGKGRKEYNSGAKHRQRWYDGGAVCRVLSVIATVEQVPQPD